MLFAWISWVYSRPLLLRAILVYYTHTLSLSQVPVLTVSYNFFSVAQAYIYYKDLHYQCPLSLSFFLSLWCNPEIYSRKVRDCRLTKILWRSERATVTQQWIVSAHDEFSMALSFDMKWKMGFVFWNLWWHVFSGSSTIKKSFRILLGIPSTGEQHILTPFALTDQPLVPF